MSDAQRDGELAILRRRFGWTLVVFCCIPLSLGALTVIDWHNNDLRRWILLALGIATAAAIPVWIYGMRNRLSKITATPPSAFIIESTLKFFFWMPFALASSFVFIGTLVVGENFDVPLPLLIVIFAVSSATGLVSYVRIMTITGYLQDAARSKKTGNAINQ